MGAILDKIKTCCSSIGLILCNVLRVMDIRFSFKCPNNRIERKYSLQNDRFGKSNMRGSYKYLIKIIAAEILMQNTISELTDMVLEVYISGGYIPRHRRKISSTYMVLKRYIGIDILVSMIGVSSLFLVGDAQCFIDSPYKFKV